MTKVYLLHWIFFTIRKAKMQEAPEQYSGGALAGICTYTYITAMNGFQQGNHLKYKADPIA
jgi:hypothetical protein